LLLTTKRFVSAAISAQAILGGIVLGMAGCDAFNPAFLNLVAPDSPAAGASLPNAPGYVVVAMQNNVTIDGQLLAYLLPELDLSVAEQQALRARVRMRVRITQTDGTFQTVEMISGSTNFVDPDFDSQSEPDLDQNTLFNVVPRCDVASVQLEPDSNVEVFIPVPIEVWEQVEVDEGDQAGTEFIQRAVIAPQFRPLEVDDVDADGNIILRRNIDVRDVLSPTTNVVCGTVIAIVVDGVLTVPFLAGVSANPSFDQDDEETEAGIGGRYEFRVSVQ
jgi:hypothetical protein